MRLFDLPKATHLKIDVDGGEDAVLDGAGDTLRSPTLKHVLIEVESGRTDLGHVERSVCRGRTHSGQRRSTRGELDLQLALRTLGCVATGVRATPNENDDGSSRAGPWLMRSEETSSEQEEGPPRRIWAPLVADADELRLIQDSIRAFAAPGHEIQTSRPAVGDRGVPLDGLDYRLTGIELIRMRFGRESRLSAILTTPSRRPTHRDAARGFLRRGVLLLRPGTRDGPEAILRNFQIWLKPGGIDDLRVPDRDSVYGFLARMTPHWIDVAVYRYVLGKAQAGKPGFAPYPTVYDPVVSFSTRGRRISEQNNLRLRAAVGHFRFRSGTRSQLMGFVSRLIAKLSLGRLAGDHANLTFIIETPGPREASPTPADERVRRRRRPAAARSAPPPPPPEVRQATPRSRELGTVPADTHSAIETSLSRSVDRGVGARRRRSRRSLAPTNA